MTYLRTNQKINLKKLQFNHLRALCFFTLLAVIFTSCSSDDDSTTTNSDPETEYTQPTVVLTNGEEGVFNAVLGSPTLGTLNHQINAVAEDGFDTLTIYKVFDGNTTEYETIDTNHPNYISNSNEFTYELNYILNSENEVETELYFQAVITDVNGNSASLNFAEVNVRRPMTKSQVTVETVNPPNGNINIPYYLHVNSTSHVSAVNHDTAVDVNLDQDIFAIFSVNESGFYLGSPNIIAEAVLTNGIQNKATTTFKEPVFSPSESLITSTYNIFDVYEIEQAYTYTSFTEANEQKAEQIDIVGSLFYFKTDDGRTGVLQTKSFDFDGQNASLTLDIFITQ